MFLSAPFVPLVVAVVLLFPDEAAIDMSRMVTLTELRERLHKRGRCWVSSTPRASQEANALLIEWSTL